MRRFRTVIVFFVGVLPLVLTGCASRPLPRIEAQYYQQCVKPLVRMQEADNRLAQSTARAALGGALAGAIIGIIGTAGSPHALPLGIGIGAAAGAAVGAVAGYSFAKLDQISDENVRFASIRITANQDLSRANRLQLYSYESMVCYMREFDSLQTAYEQGSITREDYRLRFVEIHAAMLNLGKIIGRMDAEIARTESEFNASFSRQRTPPQASAPAVSPSPPAAPAPSSAKPAIRSRQRLSSTLAQRRVRIEKAQEKNDADLTAMLEECSGKVTPPRQDVQAIQGNYGSSYAETRQEISDLRSTHREALVIMQEAALQSGIDVV